MLEMLLINIGKGYAVILRESMAFSASNLSSFQHS